MAQHVYRKGMFRKVVINDDVSPQQFADLVNGKGRGVDALVAKHGKKAVLAMIKIARGR